MPWRSTTSVCGQKIVWVQHKYFSAQESSTMYWSQYYENIQGLLGNLSTWRSRAETASNSPTVSHVTLMNSTTCLCEQSSNTKLLLDCYCHWTQLLGGNLASMWAQTPTTVLKCVQMCQRDNRDLKSCIRSVRKLIHTYSTTQLTRLKTQR